MSRRGGTWLWWVPALLPIFWLSGYVLTSGPPALRVALGIAPWDDFSWLVPLVVRILMLGLVLSLVARALGPASLRTLLTTEQACWIGGLVSALVWVSVTGLVWADFVGDSTGLFVWRIILGAAFDLFTVTWLGLAIRAAASVQPERTGGLLLGGALGTFFAAYGGLRLVMLLLYRFQPEPNVAILGIVLFFFLAMWLVPPVLAQAGVTALLASLRRTPPRSGDQEGPAILPED